MKTIREIKPSELNNDNLDISIKFSNNDKCGSVYKNTFIYVKLSKKDYKIYEINTKFNKSYTISFDTLKWLYDNKRFDRKDKRKIKMLINHITNNFN